MSLLIATDAAALGSPAESSARRAKLDGAEVHYTNFGEGDFAVVLVHGWNCDEGVWKAQVPALAAKVRVITVDLRGTARATSRRSPTPWICTRARLLRCWKTLR